MCVHKARRRQRITDGVGKCLSRSLGECQALREGAREKMGALLLSWLVAIVACGGMERSGDQANEGESVSRQRVECWYLHVYRGVRRARKIRHAISSISHATQWAWFKCYHTTSQPRNQAIFCQSYLVILFSCFNKKKVIALNKMRVLAFLVRGRAFKDYVWLLNRLRGRLLDVNVYREGGGTVRPWFGAS